MDENVPTSAGLSSYNLLDEQKFFAALGLAPGMKLLDFGCGVGNYAIAAAPYIEANGCICAVDLWEEGIETLEIRAAMAKFNSIRTSVCGAGNRLPFDNRIFDFCLMATVVHILVREHLISDTMQEMARVLKPGGRVGVVEFHKKDAEPGPPFDWRLSPDDLQQILSESGFQFMQTVDVGPHNYLSLFHAPTL